MEKTTYKNFLKIYGIGSKKVLTLHKHIGLNIRKFPKTLKNNQKSFFQYYSQSFLLDKDLKLEINKIKKFLIKIKKSKLRDNSTINLNVTKKNRKK